MNTLITLYPSALYETLGYDEKLSWRTRAAVMNHLPYEEHNGAMEIKDADEADEHNSASSVMARWNNLQLRETHSRLMDQARTCQAVEDVEEVQARAQLRLESCKLYTDTLAAAKDQLEASPEAQQILEGSTLDEANGVVAMDGPLGCLLRLIGDLKRLRRDIQHCAALSYGRAAEARVIAAWNDSCPLEEHMSHGGDISLAVPWIQGCALSGRVDGQLQDRVIVEIKCRTSRFVGLRERERMQMQAYMFMSGGKEAVLVEAKVRRASVVMRAARVAFDAAAWEETTARARRLISVQHELQQRPLFRSVFFSLSEKQQKKMLQNLLLGEESRAADKKRKRDI